VSEQSPSPDEDEWSTLTNSGDDSRGFSFGLQGDLFIPVVISATVSAMLLTVLLTTRVVTDLVAAVVLASLPFDLVLLYVLLLKQNRPPHYDVDILEEFILGGDGFERSSFQPEHPRLQAAKIEEDSKNKKESRR
jgi:hypothetical protein